MHSLQVESPLEWWQAAQSVVREEGAVWARGQSTRGFSQLEAAVRPSSPFHVVRSGWEYLEQQGLCPGSTGYAYRPLASFLAYDPLEVTHQQSMDKLRKELQTKAERVEDSRQRRREVLRLMKEMEERRTVMRLRDPQCNYAQNREQMASMLQKFWEGVMLDNAVTAVDCTRYLESLPIPADVKSAATLLFRPVRLPLVQGALRQMKPHSSPGLDGIQVSVYQAMDGLFSAKMVVIMEQFLAGGSVPEDWTATILKCIPKSISAETPDKQRPLALQNTKVKWVSAIMLLQIHDVLQAITPSSQTGFLRGRQMVEHAIEAVDFWGRTRRCVVVAIDFQKAYDSVQHSFFQAMLRYLMIGRDYIALLMQLLTAELVIEVCGEVVPTAVVRPVRVCGKEILCRRHCSLL